MTEHEIQNGILEIDHPENHGLVFIREMTGLDSPVYHEEMATRYKDTLNNDGKVSIRLIFICWLYNFTFCFHKMYE